MKNCPALPAGDVVTYLPSSITYAGRTGRPRSLKGEDGETTWFLRRCTGMIYKARK